MPRGQPTAEHEGCIAEILKQYPKAKTRMFRKSVVAAVKASVRRRDWAKSDDRWLSDNITVIPDAYMILPDIRLCVCWEVSLHSLYRPRKYGSTFWGLDMFYWGLSVIEVNARTRSWRKVPTYEEAYAHLYDVKAEASSGIPVAQH